MLRENFIPWLNSILHLNRSLEGLEIFFESEMKHEKKSSLEISMCSIGALRNKEKLKLQRKKLLGNHYLQKLFKDVYIP